MRLNLLSQEEGGDGLSHLAEFIPSPLFKSIAPEISQGRVLTCWEGWEQEEARKKACIYPPSSLFLPGFSCQYCWIAGATSPDSEMLWQQKRHCKSPWLTAPDIFALPVHIHTGFLLAATHQMKPMSFEEMFSKPETRWVLPPCIKFTSSCCSKLQQ